MAAPTVVGFASSRESYGVATYTRSIAMPAGVQAGDTVFLAVAIAGASTTTFDPTGWTVVQPLTTVGTRSWTVLAKTVTAADVAALSYTFTTTGGGGMTLAVVVTRGGDLAARTVGAPWMRNTDGTGGTDARTLGRPMAVTAPSLVLSFHGEATTALETAPPTVAGGTLVGHANYQTAASSNIEQVLAVAEPVTSGSSSTHLVTWQNTSQNGVATAVVLPGVTAGPPPATGNLARVGSSHFTQTSLRVSAAVTDASRTVTATSGTTTRTLAVDPVTRWGWADFPGLEPGTAHTFRFAVDGVEQTDVVLDAATMPAGPSSFVVVAGSCQFTGSDHPVWDRIREERALFAAHSGDLHYEDARTAEAWRAGVDASMNAPRFRAMLASTPLTWQWDNHDRLIVDTLNLGTTDPATLTQYRTYAGTDGWPGATTNNRTWVAGRVRFIQTDHWTVRDDPDLVAEPRTMMGAEQKQWFKDTLAAATEPVIVWFTQWTGQNNANGRWNSFVAETTELEQWINARPGIKARMIHVGGDSHSLQADSGTRVGSHRFAGVPSLNVSGFNRAAMNVTGTVTPAWDIACRTIFNDPATEPEAKWGAYSRITVDDDGTNVRLLWEAVRVDDTGAVDVLASYERTLGTVVVDGKPCTVWSWDPVRGRSVPLSFVAPSTMPAGLAAQWTFDDPANLGAERVAGRTLALEGATPLAARGGYALAASGAAARGVADDGFLSRDGFTVCAWVLPTSATSASSQRVAFLMGGTAVAELYYWYRSLAGSPYDVRRASIVIGGSSKNAVSQVRDTSGGANRRWHMLAAVYDGTAIRLYEDGALLASTAATGIVDDPDTFEAYALADGAIDDVEVWDYPFTAAEVAARFAETNR